MLLFLFVTWSKNSSLFVSFVKFHLQDFEENYRLYFYIFVSTKPLLTKPFIIVRVGFLTENDGKLQVFQPIWQKGRQQPFVSVFFCQVAAISIYFAFLLSKVLLKNILPAVMCLFKINL